MKIRPSQRFDAHAISCIYVQTWQDTYLGIVPFAYLYAMSVDQHEQAFLKELAGRQVLSYVAEDNGRVVGFTTGGFERHRDAIYGGEIYTLYVLKNYQRRGIGRLLVEALTRRFNHLGIHSMLVQVLKQNPYRNFYRKINGLHLKTQRLPFAGEVLHVEFYGWIDISLIYP
jgi:ribosomal protein S18 acetylase RimI-like enzyme